MEDFVSHHIFKIKSEYLFDQKIHLKQNTIGTTILRNVAKQSQ